MLTIEISGDRSSGKTQALAICVAALLKAGYNVNHLTSAGKPYEEYFLGLVDAIASGRSLPQDHRVVHVREVDTTEADELLPLAELAPEAITQTVVGDVETTQVPAGSDLILAAIAMGRDVDISIRKPTP